MNAGQTMLLRPPAAVLRVWIASDRHDTESWLGVTLNEVGCELLAARPDP
jgi:hypothetical protein